MTTRKYYIYIISFVSIIIAGCAAPKPTAKPYTTEPAPISLTMPSGWDDSIIELIKTNKGLKKRVAVLDFEGNEKLKDKVDLKLSDLLITSMVKSGKFDVIERTKMEKVLNEQKLSMTGLIDESTAVAMGKLLGVEYVVFGSITSATQQNIDKFGYILVVIEVSVDVRAVDAITGKILLAEHASGTSESKVIKTSEGTVVQGAVDYNSAYAHAAQRAITVIGKSIGELFPLLGYVVMVNDSKVTTDIGEDRGVTIGNQFVVFRIGEEILHPATGQHIGWSKDILATIVIQSTEKTLSTGHITRLKSPDSLLQAGDLIISFK